MKHTCCVCGKQFESWQTVAIFTGPDGLGGSEIKRTCSRECTPKDKLSREFKQKAGRTFGVE